MARKVAEKGDLIPLLAEAFREHGYEGASLSRLQAATGLGRGSLYHFFPGGKEEMAATVLGEIDRWFEEQVFAPLRTDDAATAIGAMCDATVAYFRSGARVCLVGAFALTDAKDRFGDAIRAYFARWIDALAGALERGGAVSSLARSIAEDGVAAVQGAIVISRATNDLTVFARILERFRDRAFGVVRESVR